ncbi:MAG: aryl-sulfate sulfotransferase [Acidobacteria bacterium]|nr:aryl-sulfate sulfotransferase [Acidobacteriota bacterium]
MSALLSACDRRSTEPTRPPAAVTPAPPAVASPPADWRQDLERLRALGYMDYSDAPALPAGKGVTLLDRKRASPGYTLVVFARTCTAQLVTLEGTVVRSWSDRPCHRWEHAELLPEGDLLVVGTRFDPDRVSDPTRLGRYLMRLSWDGKADWRSDLNAHHDVEVTPRGQLLTLVAARRRIASVDPDADVWDDRLTLLTQDGAVVESVSLYDVLTSSRLRFPLQIVGRRAEKDGSRTIDLFHSNAAEWVKYPELAGRGPLYGADNVLVTSRHQDAVFMIDWPSRQLVWFWGPGNLSGPHDATLQPNGNILIFDNGLARRWSRVVELDPRAPSDLLEISFPRKGQFFSRVMGTSQRLANGNLLITNPAGGQGIELGSDGQPAWIYEGTERTPDGRRAQIARMRRFPSSFVDAIVAGDRSARPR